MRPLIIWHSAKDSRNCDLKARDHCRELVRQSSIACIIGDLAYKAVIRSLIC
jgi:hypothetical protein